MVILGSSVRAGFFLLMAGRSDRAVAMRVHERGSGETRSCGTGACAAAAAFADATGVDRPASIDLAVPGGALEVVLRDDGGVDLVGPAVLVAEGNWPLGA